MTLNACEPQAKIRIGQVSFDSPWARYLQLPPAQAWGLFIARRWIGASIRCMYKTIKTHVTPKVLKGLHFFVSWKVSIWKMIKCTRVHGVTCDARFVQLGSGHRIFASKVHPTCHGFQTKLLLPLHPLRWSVPWPWKDPIWIPENDRSPDHSRNSFQGSVEPTDAFILHLGHDNGTINNQRFGQRLFGG